MFNFLKKKSKLPFNKKTSNFHEHFMGCIAEDKRNSEPRYIKRYLNSWGQTVMTVEVSASEVPAHLR